MDQSAFGNACRVSSSWAELRKDFDDGGADAACYRVGNDTYFASAPKEAPISPLWLLTMVRPGRSALKGVTVHTNYCDGLGQRSNSEIGVMKLSLEGMPNITRAAKLTLADLPAGKVYRVAITGTLVDALEKQFPVPAGRTTIVNDIGSISASEKDGGVYKAAGTHNVHRLYLATAYILLAHKHGAKRKDGVVALVVDKTGNIVSWGMKNPLVSCWHGETSAIMRLRGELPAGGCVFTTLKPCRMCGGLISDASRKTMGAYYGQDDAGADAAKTALDRDKHNFPLDVHKGPALPRGLVLPIGEAGAKEPLGARLQSDFTAQQKSGIGSPIDYVTSAAAADLMGATKAMFEAKVKKYATVPDKPGTQNPHTRTAVQYLSNFLAIQGVKIG
jgi:tRNA(Arg) A34 adenosine deaminase TadA